MKELVTYIYQQQKAGYSNEYIREQLRTNGWDEETIAKGFNEALSRREDRAWTAYSVGSIALIFAVSMALAGVAELTGFATATDIACLLEDPAQPGYYDIVHSPEDCLQLIRQQACEPLNERLALEADGNIIFEGSTACKGRYNVYFA